MPNGAVRPVPPPAGPSLNISDIYYILFRHKWKILICSLLGFAAAGAFYKLRPPPYQSEARLFVRFVITEGRTIGPGEEAMTKSPDQRGETIMSSEIQILTSLDLARQVAQAVGPERILAGTAGGNDLNAATAQVLGGLAVDVIPKSSVIRIIYRHPDAGVVQPVLRQVVDEYLKMHVSVHRASGLVGDFLSQETDQLRARLAQTEEELRRANAKAGVVSLEKAKETFAEEMARLRQELFQAQAELESRRAVVAKLGQSTESAPAASVSPELEPGLVAEYQRLVERVAHLSDRERQLLTQFTSESIRVQEIRNQRIEAETAKLSMEREHPQLVKTAPAPNSGAPVPSAFNLDLESANLAALETRIKVLNAQMEQLRTEAAAVDQMEVMIHELRRRKELEEANYRRYAASLEQSRISEALGAGKVSNISQIQSPTPPFKDWSKSLKILAAIAAAGVAVGLAWAFAIELYLDRTIRRPTDFERKLHLPLFLTVPRLGRRARKALGSAASAAPSASYERLGMGTDTQEAIARADEVRSNPLHVFHETLRDRLIGYFENKGLTHKPKLVAVTGLGRESGVTTTAAGLASSLSDTGDGNVLLVDLTPGQGAAQQFYRGRPVCGLDQVLDARNGAQVQDNLFVVVDQPGTETLSRVLPSRFNKLVPKLKASDFDYIIFDMPPVSQTSITPRLAGYMDMVLMVVESEKTDQEAVRRATSLLAASNAHVGAVLTKARNYVPSVLQTDAVELV